jgi:hypothetical protein
MPTPRQEFAATTLGPSPGARPAIRLDSADLLGRQPLVETRHGEDRDGDRCPSKVRGRWSTVDPPPRGRKGSSISNRLVTSGQ